MGLHQLRRTIASPFETLAISLAPPVMRPNDPSLLRGLRSFLLNFVLVSYLQARAWKLMMICEVQDDLVPSVHEFLCQRSGFSPKTCWEPLFNYPWKNPEFPYGYALVDDQRQIQGFLGTIYTRRMINGKSFLSCNLSCWTVDENYRARLGKAGKGVGRRMLEPVLAQKDVIATALSTNALSAKSFLSAGFKSLDSEQTIIPVIPGFRGFGETRNVKISFKTCEIGSRLSENEREIWKDHRGLPCKHFLMDSPDSGEYCYGIATTAPIRRVARFGEKVFNLCYISNPQLFARHFWSLAGALWGENRLALVRYDKRLIPETVSVMARAVNSPRWFYYASGIEVPEVDLAYTEFVLYNVY